MEERWESSCTAPPSSTLFLPPTLFHPSQRLDEGQQTLPTPSPSSGLSLRVLRKVPPRASKEEGLSLTPQVPREGRWLSHRLPNHAQAGQMLPGQLQGLRAWMETCVGSPGARGSQTCIGLRERRVRESGESKAAAAHAQGRGEKKPAQTQRGRRRAKRPSRERGAGHPHEV